MIADSSINATSDLQEGYNGGRQYIFSLESEKIFEEWDSFIEKQAAICFKNHTKRSKLEELRVGPKTATHGIVRPQTPSPALPS